MFIKIDDAMPETEPANQQCIAFKTGASVFAGVYHGDKKAKPFAPAGIEPPIFVIEEWMPVRIWG